MPTLLDMADVAHPGQQFRDREVVSMQGSSLVPLLRGEAETVHPPDYYIGWELFGKRALRQGDWKIIYAPYHELWEPRPPGIQTDRWQLYNLAADPTERYDLSQRHPDRLRDMVSLWARYAYDNGVIIPDWVSGY